VHFRLGVEADCTEATLTAVAEAVNRSGIGRVLGA